MFPLIPCDECNQRMYITFKEKISEKQNSKEVIPLNSSSQIFLINISAAAFKKRFYEMKY